MQHLQAMDIPRVVNSIPNAFVNHKSVRFGYPCHQWDRSANCYFSQWCSVYTGGKKNPETMDWKLRCFSDAHLFRSLFSIDKIDNHDREHWPNKLSWIFFFISPKLNVCWIVVIKHWNWCSKRIMMNISLWALYTAWFSSELLSYTVRSTCPDLRCHAQ